MSQQDKPLNPNPEQPQGQTPPPLPPLTPLLAAVPSGSETLLPNDHLELLIELMRPGSVELARRWVSALMLVPADEREAIVAAVEAQIVADYCQED